MWTLLPCAWGWLSGTGMHCHHEGGVTAEATVATAAAAAAGVAAAADLTAALTAAHPKFPLTPPPQPGTTNLDDMLTDACASCEPYCGGYAHLGMLKAARCVATHAGGAGGLRVGWERTHPRLCTVLGCIAAGTNRAGTSGELLVGTYFSSLPQLLAVRCNTRLQVRLSRNTPLTPRTTHPHPRPALCC